MSSRSKKQGLSKLTGLFGLAFLLLLASLVIYLVLVLQGSDSEAAKGGRGKPQPSATCSSGTATVALVSSNPVPVGTSPTFHVTGYKSGELVYMVMSGYIRSDGVNADSTGNIDYTFREGMYSPGSYTFTSTLLNGVNCAKVAFTVK